MERTCVYIRRCLGRSRVGPKDVWLLRIHLSDFWWFWQVGPLQDWRNRRNQTNVQVITSCGLWWNSPHVAVPRPVFDPKEIPSPVEFNITELRSIQAARMCNNTCTLPSLTVHDRRRGPHPRRMLTFSWDHWFTWQLGPPEANLTKALGFVKHGKKIGSVFFIMDAFKTECLNFLLCSVMPRFWLHWMKFFFV